jgi:glutathione synthase/RimK-type ligase-like ATP-grasp enzyme
MRLFRRKEGHYFMKNVQQNQQRQIVKIIKEICVEQDISCTSFSYDWIFRLCKNDRVSYVFGYNFGLNTATSALLCKDKCATSDILLNVNIPVVEHFLFFDPNNIHYIGESGNWSRLTDLLKKYSKLVCKVNEGTGGNDVYLVENQSQLEKAAQHIFNQSRTMAVSPFYSITKEYRAVFLGEEVKLIYSKNIPFIAGDGQSTIHSLLIKYMSESNCLIDNISIPDDTLFSILPRGEKYFLDWKFNLGQGAVSQIVYDEEKKRVIEELAIKTAKALTVQFASIDIIDTDHGFRVLEVNNGIMMESFAKESLMHYKIAKTIYEQAIQMMLL